MFGQKKIAMILAELLGVYFLTMVVYSMLARTPFPFFSGIAAGLTITVLTLVIGNLSGAHINPAVTISMWGMRRVNTIKAIVYIAAQMAGAVLAWATIRYFLQHSLTSMAGAHFEWRVLIAEALGTAVFVFGAASAMLQKFEPAKAAAIIGASFAIGVMIASLASNGILNPAVALGVQSWDWAYATGPIIGALIGSNVYYLMYAGVPKIATKSTSSKKKR